MAKQLNNGNSNNGHNGDERGYTIPDVITTSRGEKVHLIGLNPARLEKLQSVGKMPPVPFREIPNDLGDSQKENLSENDLQNDEEREQWREYKEKCAAVETKRNENVMKYIFTDGFNVDVSKMDEWAKLEEEEYGIELPTSPIQLKMDFINAKVIGTADDLGNIMAGVLERTGVPADMLDDIRDSFRGTVRQSTPVETPTE